MAEATQYLFDHKEVVTALLKKEGIHEGLWGIMVEIGFSATSLPTSPDGSSVIPAAINLIQRIGIKRQETENNVVVDAAVVNPAPKSTKSIATGKARRRA